MKTALLIPLLLFACCFAVPLLGQEEKTTSEETKAPVPIQPLTIGPKCGKGEGKENETEGSSETGSVEATKPNGALEIIFDCSNSMNARMGGVPKIDLAKKALYELTDRLSGSSLQIGFRVFGHDKTIDREDRPRACVNSELVIPIAPDTAKRIRGLIPSLVAWGRTPIAYSFQEAGKDLNSFLENKPMVLLISDGIESCDGDPVATILELKDRGIDVQTYVIGFDLSAEERLALQKIAAAGDGKYYNASNYSELVEAFDAFLKDTGSVVAPPRERFSNPVEGGSSWEESVEIGPGRYTVWKDLKKGEWAHFKVPTRKGQRLVVKETLQATAIYRDESGNIVEHPYALGNAMAKFFDPEGKVINGRGILIRGELGKWCRQHVFDVSGTGSFFAVGDNYSPTSRHLEFEVIVVEAGDLFEGWEAPDSVDSPSVFKAPVAEAFHAHLGIEDRADVYEVSLEGEGTPEKLILELAMKPTYSWRGGDEPEEFRYQVEVFDAESGKRIQRFTKLEGESSLEIETAGAKKLLVKIEDKTAVLYHMFTSYSMKVAVP